ncbi:MAG: histidine kinase N-terminal domain-containing protein [Acidimicrobiales bacterium]
MAGREDEPSHEIGTVDRKAQRSRTAVGCCHHGDLSPALPVDDLGERARLVGPGGGLVRPIFGGVDDDVSIERGRDTRRRPERHRRHVVVQTPVHQEERESCGRQRVGHAGDGTLNGVASLSDLARQHTSLGPEERTHLRRLVASWGLLADLSFADLLLFGVAEGTEERFVILGQIRPTTAQTLYRDDLVGRFISAEHRPLVAAAMADGQRVDDEIDLPLAGRRAAVQAVPVVFGGRPIAVLTSETPRLGARMPGELEHTYLGVFQKFVAMIQAGTFPFAYEDAETEQSPRVGDGVMVLDERGTIVFTSPNAVSALHRIGFHANAIGRELEAWGSRPARCGRPTAYACRSPKTSSEVRRCRWWPGCCRWSTTMPSTAPSC